MITLKTNMTTTQEYYSLILIVLCMKLKPNMFMRILIMIIQLTQCDYLNKLITRKIKDETGGVFIKKFFIQAIYFWYMIVVSIKKQRV